MLVLPFNLMEVSMSKHSPGPWYIDGFDVKVNKPEREFLGDGAPETICEMLSSVCPEETAANQRLIAAAPDLLTSLRMFLSLDPRCHRGVEHCGECAACLGAAAIANAS